MQHSIDYLRRQAKALNRAHSDQQTDALRRVSAIFPDQGEIRHTQALHVIAREMGFESWPKLKLSIELANLGREERAERLKIALYLGQNWIVDSILENDPSVADSNLGLQVALYRIEDVKKALDRNPDMATTLVGVRSPILHLAFSKHWQNTQDGAARSVDMADLIVRHGADVNDSYPAEPGSDHRLSVLYGALGHAGNVTLAEWLLEHGADPNDDESLYHATELGHLDGVRLLMRHGVKTSGTNALARMLDFDNIAGVQLLLEYGADPNEAVLDHPSGQPIDTVPALHQAARRGRDGRFAELLLEFGADPTDIWQGKTPYELARLYGNADFANTLRRAGHATAIAPSVAMLAACASGQAPNQKVDPAKLSEEERRLLTRVILWPNHLDHAKALVDAGLDPNEVEEMGMTPLHLAGWAGLPAQVEWLLTLDPDLSHVNDYGGEIVGTIIHGSENRLDTEDRDHVGCLRRVLTAGATLSRRELDGAMDESVVAFLQDWAAQHPDRISEDP